MRRRLQSIFLVMALAMMLIGCGNTYNLAVGVQGEGTVSPGTGVHEYERGTRVPLTVTPAEGWGFVGWSGPHGDMVLLNTILMDENKYITAVFAKLEHQLDVFTEPAWSGTVDVVIEPATRGIEHGQTVRLTAKPHPHYVFGYWNDDVNDTANPKSFVMDSPKSIKATFIEKVADPEIALGEGPAGSYVDMQCFTTGATIRYTTDGVTVPTSTVGDVYIDSIRISQSTVIKAIAYKQGMADSNVVTQVYNFKAPQPMASLSEGIYEGSQSIELSTPNGNGMTTIRYSINGLPPTPQQGTLYTRPILLQNGTFTLRAVAYGAGVSTSDVLTQTYTIQNWRTRASMPTARKGLAAVAVNGIIYAIGGYNGTSYLGTVEAYNPVTNTWQTKTPMPTARGYLTAVAFNGSIYAIGGATNSAPSSKMVERYDPLTDTWTRVADALYETLKLTAVTVGDHIFAVAGGHNQTYSPADNLWAEYDAPPKDVYYTGYGAAVIDDVIFFVGGSEPDGNSNNRTTTYTPIEGWSFRNNAPYPMEEVAAAAINGKFYAFGGINSPLFGSISIYDQVSIYDPVRNEWTNGPKLPQPRYAHAAVALGNSVFIIGGETSGGVQADMIEFLP